MKKIRDRRAAVSDWLCYVGGCVLYAVAVNVFITPNRLVPGGATGVAVLIHHLWPPFPVGAGIFLLNLPLLWVAWVHLGHRFTRRTAVVTAIASASIDMTAPFLKPYTADPLLAVLFGGVLSGAGLSLVLLRGATTGGTEIVARLLEKKYPHISVGRFMVLVDGAVIAASIPVFGQVQAAMYAVVLVFVTSLVVDERIGGARRTRTVLIVSEPIDDLARTLTARLERGVTVLAAQGAYTGQNRRVLICAVRPSEVHPLRRLVAELDPAAFLIVLNSEQVIGTGFQTEFDVS